MAVTVYAEIGNIEFALKTYDRMLKEYPEQKRELAVAACELSFRWIQGILSRTINPSEDEVARVESVALMPGVLDPDDAFLAAKAESALGHYYLSCAKNPVRADEILSDLLVRHPTTPFTAEVVYHLACARRQNGDTAGALVLYERLINDMQPLGYIAPAMYAAAGCCLSSGDDAGAELFLNRIIAGAGNDDWKQMARVRLGALHARNGNYNAAVALLFEARNQMAAELQDAKDSQDPAIRSGAAQIQERIADLDSQIQQITELASGRAD